MKTELSIIKIKCDQTMINQDILIPSTARGIEILKSLPYAKKMQAQINYNSNHSLERHDLFWACVNLVAENTGKSELQIVETCKIDCRWIKGYTTYKDKNNNERVNVITKSISFSKMSLQDANEFYSKAFDILASYLEITTDELINEAKLRMKEKHYCQLCGKPSSQRHHCFPQTKYNVEKYGRALIDDERNICWLCIDCHISHNKIPKELIWNEKKFREIILGVKE